MSRIAQDVAKSVLRTGVAASFLIGLSLVAPAAALAENLEKTVVEFHNASLDHYFVTHDELEISTLDYAIPSRGWERTGETWRVRSAPAAGMSPVCRFYIPPSEGDSHFYGRGAAECAATAAGHPSFINESSAFFHVALPVQGTCPPGTRNLYRVFNNQRDANHRYTTDRGIRDLMVELGWVAEGDGDERVAMCVAF
jgi:hypothetical protein